jgi:hypothetical protein
VCFPGGIRALFNSKTGGGGYSVDAPWEEEDSLPEAADVREDDMVSDACRYAYEKDGDRLIRSKIRVVIRNAGRGVKIG